ncbi:MAG: hypothetical protein VX993_04330 [Candidatus Neomarinimicrobiota bacterium]|nr:hypothetical protein [Candidatus Neomarinimicrobiota bacterium]
MHWNKLILSSLLLLITTTKSETINTYKGYVDFYYISRLSDQSIINIPYRIFSLNLDHQNGDLMLRSTIALEHRLRNDTYFLSNNSPTDFELDMRELYLQMFTSWGEIRLGKIIHTWGNADENSPVDIASPFDYYYTFDSGIDKKLAIFSSAIDVYMENMKLGLIFSPLHNTHRTPQNDDEFPIKLPVSPSEDQIMKIGGLPYELGAYINRSFSFGDISLNYFTGYDRLFNLSGVNGFGHGPSLSNPYIDVVYGYRKTNMTGLGSTLFFGDLELRGDVAVFNTEDENNNISRISPDNPEWFDSLHYSYPLNEKARYFQTTVQLEAELPFDIKFVGQFFNYDTLDYSSDSLPLDEDVSIPNLEISVDELDPKNIFTPGYGSSLAIMTKKALILSLEKKFFDDQLILTASSIFDIDNTDYDGTSPGSILSLEAAYTIIDNLELTVGYTNIKGDKDHPLGENYRLYIMEDFSHIRADLKYSF